MHDQSAQKESNGFGNYTGLAPETVVGITAGKDRNCKV
jgi:hypothetical protein